MRAYYNEIDEAAAAILTALIEDNVIAPGDVDTRSIKDVHPDDLTGYTQCHFFAGGGLWSVAARLACWPDDRPLWTGSCPCQPFSTAGKGEGTDDPRHLWPDFHRLIRAGRPAVVMGEQVAGKAGRDWFHGVRSDLANCGYAGRAVDIPACAVDAPQQRNRLYWIGIANGTRSARDVEAIDRAYLQHRDGIGRRGDPDSVLADLHGRGRHGRAESEERGTLERTSPQRAALRNGSFWSGSQWIDCRDRRRRRAEPGLPFLAHGIPGRMDLWRVAGNAISPVLAAQVIGSFIDSYGLPDRMHGQAGR